MTTIGWPEEPTSSSTSSSNKTVVSTFTPTEAGNLESATAWLELTAGTTNAQFVVYSDNSGQADVLLAQSDVTVLDSGLGKNNYQFTFSGDQALVEIGVGVPIWFGVTWADPGDPSINFFRSPGSSSGLARQVNTYLPSPFGSTSTLSGPQSVSLTYSAEPATETHKFYLTNAPAPIVPGLRTNGFDGAQGDSLSEPFLLGESPQGSSDSRAASEVSGVSGYGVMLAQFVSAPATADGTVTGLYTLGIGREGDAAGQLRTRWVFWAMTPESGLRAGTVYTGGSFATDTPLGYRLSDDLIDMEFLAGDRLIVEVGYSGVNTSETPYEGTLYYGGTGSTDIAHEDSDVTRPKFLEFSTTLGVTFVEPIDTSIPPGTEFDLSLWHLTTPAEDPVDHDAEQIDQPALDTYASEFFYLDTLGRMVFHAPVEGFTTSGLSGATRSELREHEADYDNSAWDPATTELRRMTITTQVDASQVSDTGTDPQKQMIFWQIHGEGGTPPLYLAAEFDRVDPRVRLFAGDPFFDSGTDYRDNPLTNITTDTFITVRCEVEQGEVRLWVIEGQVEDLSGTPTYTFPVSGFSDVPNWYFKAGAYNKTAIGEADSGYVESRISYFELIQPGAAPIVYTNRFFLSG